MTMSNPGTPFTSVPAAPRQTTVAPAAVRRLGLIAMAPNSGHLLTIRQPGKAPFQVQCIAQDRRALPRDVKLVFFCQHPQCSSKTPWSSFADMAKDHQPQSVLERAGEVHLFGCWSDDPAPGAEAMDAKDGKKARPVIGLVAPLEDR